MNYVSKFAFVSDPKKIIEMFVKQEWRTRISNWLVVQIFLRNKQNTYLDVNYWYNTENQPEIITGYCHNFS